MKRLILGLLLIAGAAHARIEVKILDRPPYYRDEPIRIRVVTDDNPGALTPNAENATVERESGSVFRITAKKAGLVTVGPFVAGSETAPPVSFHVGSEISSSTEPNDVLLARLKREGHVPLVIRVDVVPATPIEGQLYKVTWSAATDNLEPHLVVEGLEETHWSGPLEASPAIGTVGRVDLYRAELLAPHETVATLPELTFTGFVNFPDGSSQVVQRIVPPMTITIAPAPVPDVPVGEFDLRAGLTLPVGSAGEIPSAWHPIAVIANGSGKLDKAAPPEVNVPPGVAYTVRPVPELVVIRGPKAGFVRQWTYDIHSTEPLDLQFRFRTYSPFAQMKRDVVANAKLPAPTPRNRRPTGGALGLIPTIIFDAMLGATLVIALAISRRS